MNPAKPGVSGLLKARADGLLTVVEEGDADAFPQLDAGESTVLSAAAAARAAVLVDERKARTLIEHDPRLQAITHAGGIVGLILLAKRMGSVPEIRPLLDELVCQSFRISPALYDEVLRTAGEG